jgi:hypothetical protein
MIYPCTTHSSVGKTEMENLTGGTSASNNAQDNSLLLMLDLP